MTSGRTIRPAVYVYFETTPQFSAHFKNAHMPLVSTLMHVRTHQCMHTRTAIPHPLATVKISTGTTKICHSYSGSGT